MEPCLGGTFAGDGSGGGILYVRTEVGDQGNIGWSGKAVKRIKKDAEKHLWFTTAGVLCIIPLVDVGKSLSDGH